jgi:hypothetical protein
LSTQYPAAFDTWQDKTDLVDWYHAQYINQLNDAIIAVEAALGINPQGAFTAIVDRLDALTA